MVNTNFGYALRLIQELDALNDKTSRAKLKGEGYRHTSRAVLVTAAQTNAD